MRFAVLILAGLLVTGCAPKLTTKQIIAQCALDGDKLHAHDPDRYSTLSQYVQVCMQARGYEWRAGADCGPGGGYDLALLRPECYRHTPNSN
jgi:hypothetical protein